MRKNWELVSLGDICKLINGRAYKQEELLNEGKYPVLRVGNFFSNRSWYYSNLELEDSKYCNNGDLLYAWSASFGPRIWENGKVIYHYHIWKIDLDSNRVLKKFLYHWFEWDTKKIKAEQGVGTTMIHVTKGAMEKRMLYLPPIDQQKRIVAILDESFEGIDKAMGNTEKNLANSRQLFESYLNVIFSQKGNGWEEKKFGDVALLSRGQNPPKSKFVNHPQEGYVRFYQIRDGKTDDYEVYVPDTPQLHKVEPDDILMVAYRHIGRVFRGARGAFNVALCKIKNKDRSVLHDDYLFHIIPTDFVRGELMKQAERSLIPSMSVKHLAELRIPVPPIEEQEIIVSKINNLYSETQRLEAIYRQKLTALNELKQSILQKAFTGELTADKAKNASEEIAA
jgi:type I restriction enzyme S subunit